MLAARVVVSAKKQADLDISYFNDFQSNHTTYELIPLFKRSKKSGWKPVDITVFNFPGDSSGSEPFGSSGAFFKKYPTTVKIGGKRRKIFPAAVHSSLVKKYRYKILEVGKFDGPRGKWPMKRTFVHVVDACASYPCPKNHKSASKNGALLLDIQYQGAKSLGLTKNTYKTYGSSRNSGSRSWYKTRVVGKMDRKEMLKANLYYKKKLFNCNYVPSEWLDGYKSGKPIQGSVKSCW